MRRLYHVDKLLPELDEFRNHLSLALDRRGVLQGAVPSRRAGFQHNTRSNNDTRYPCGWFWREFKTFLYLDDVDEGKGPFTYIPGSHRAHLRRLRKQLRGGGEGSPTSFHSDEIEGALKREVKITGAAGTLILADVGGLHRGSPQRVGSRSVLVLHAPARIGDLPG